MAGAGVRQLQRGDRVRHPRMTEWGLGEVRDVRGDHADVFFVGEGEKTVSLRYVALEVLDPRPDHALLDRLKPGTEFRSLRRSMEDFLAGYEGGFTGDSYVAERAFKVRAGRLARTELAREVVEAALARGDHGDVCERAKSVVKETPLIFRNEKMDLQDGLKDAAQRRKFAAALSDLLHGEGALPNRFERFVAVLSHLGAATWTVATYFWFLFEPERHIFVKPSYMRDAARMWAYDLGDTTDVNWPAYERMLTFSHYLKSELEETGRDELAPRDFIDVYSFVWLILYPDGRRSGGRR